MKNHKKLNFVFKAIYVVVYTVGYTLCAIWESVKDFGKGMRNMKPLSAQRRYEQRKNRKF